MSLFESLQEIVKQSIHPQRFYWVAFSGGLDSTVLLDLCARLSKELTIKVRAVHINHGIHADSDAWAKHCKQVCQHYGIELIEQKLQMLRSSQDSLEDLARQQRYEHFSRLLASGDTLLTAHHQDDQAETILLQLLRGAGVKGLAAMPARKKCGQGWHARPFLAYPRESLEAYAKAHALRWINDSSNANKQFTRNFLRHDIFPTLKQRWPTVAATLTRSARHCAEVDVLLEEIALDLYKEVKGSYPDTVSVTKLQSLSQARQSLVLRTWIRRLDCPLPSAKKLFTIQQQVLTAAWDRLPVVAWQGAELRRYRDDLFILPKRDVEPVCQRYTWHVSEATMLAGRGLLESRLVSGRGLHQRIEKVQVRFRRGGERIRLNPHHSSALKQLFQAVPILPWERDTIPLLYLEDKLVAVAGYFIDIRYLAGVGELGHELRWTPCGQRWRRMAG